MKKQREFYHKLGMEVPGDIKGETCSAKQHLDSHRNGKQSFIYYILGGGLLIIVKQTGQKCVSQFITIRIVS